MIVIKRNGSTQEFNRAKIADAVCAAFNEVDGKLDGSTKQIAYRISKDIEKIVDELGQLSVEEIQDIVESKLMSTKRKDVARAYVRYRYKHELDRQKRNDKDILELIDGDNEYWNSENSNKNVKWVTTQRDYLAGIVSTDAARNFIFPKDVIKAHDAGIIHIHDMDYALQKTLTNCCLINLEDMLQNGTVINGVTIDKPHRILTATTIATQIISAVASSQYGGCTISLTHLAPFVRSSYDIYKNKYLEWGFNEDKACEFATKDLKKEIADSVQTLNYQLNSFTTTNGQSPFVSVMMYLNETDEYKKELAMLIEEVLNQRILGMKNKVGVYVTPAFPKLLYVLEEDNVHSDSKYYYLTQLAAKCTAKRMVPDYISEKVMKQLKLSKGEVSGQGDCYPCMGCRSFLTPDRSGNGFNNIQNALNYNPDKPKYYGRWNIGVTTINLVDAALSARKEVLKNNEELTQENMEKYFWPIMEERTELCHKAQKVRADRLKETPAEVAPIMWCDGALARLDPQEKLGKILYGGTCTSSLGYAGLYECVKVITGNSHTDHEKGHDFGVKVMQFLNDQCSKWKTEENIDYSVYGSPKILGIIVVIL